MEAKSKGEVMNEDTNRIDPPDTCIDEPCPECGGEGYDTETGIQCPECRGTGLANYDRLAP